MTRGVATMSVELPPNAFTVPVAFSIARVDPATLPGTGAAPGGGALTLSTLAAYQFTCADDRGEVAESDETNNCKATAAPIEVTR